MIKAELHHHETLNLDCHFVDRQAVRAVIYRGDEILLIFSKVNGDYKLPGGGIEPGEDHRAALKREMPEETGYHLSIVGDKIGEISEYSKAMEEDLSYFRMDSHYYKCEIGKETQSRQSLDEYEQNLEMHCVWMIISEALKRNKKVLSENPKPPQWTKREVWFLEYLIKSE